MNARDYKPGTHDEGTHDLCLAELIVLLEEERAAIVALDAERLQDITARKTELAGTLEEAVRGSAASKGVLSRQLSEVRARAEANAVLMQDAANSIAELLCAHGGDDTYDGRARLRQQHTSFGGRIV